MRPRKRLERLLDDPDRIGGTGSAHSDHRPRGGPEVYAASRSPTADEKASITGWISLRLSFSAA
jgi:hypothetical protein